MSNSSSPTVTAISVQRVGKDYFPGLSRRKVTAIHDLSFDVFGGEVFAFLGLNGAGKTTTIKLLLDHARPTTGRCLLFGIEAIRPNHVEESAICPTSPISTASSQQREQLAYFGRLHGIDRHSLNNRIDELAKLVGLAGRIEEPLKGFSRGMLQRVGLAQALISDPDLLILDEPLGGLDPVGRYDFHMIIQNLKDRGKTIFFSSHILEDAEKVADRVGIIDKGQLKFIGRLDQLVIKTSEYQAVIDTITDTSKIESISSSYGWHVQIRDGVARIDLPSETEKNRLLQLSGDLGGNLRSLQPEMRSLEAAFLEELGAGK